MTRKNSFLLFLSACIPGCGQMYQGYMKRGVSLMSLFALILGLASWLYFGQLALALPVLWLYSFFDTYNLRRALENDEAEPDAYPLGLSGMDQEQLSRLLAKRHSLVGWALVLLGLYGFWQIAANYFSRFLSELFGVDLYWFTSLQLPQLALFLLVIALGVWFIRGPKRRRGNGDFTGFTPPSGETGEQVPAPEDSGSCGADADASNDPAPSNAGADNSPEYRAVSDAVSCILQGGEAGGRESGAGGDERGKADGQEDARHDGE